MNKKNLIQEIQTHLAQELEGILEAAKSARDAATNSESKAEDQYDTRAIEASYLAGAQAQRASEIQRLLTMFKFFPLREFGEKDVICPGSIVGVEFNKKVSYYFVVPNGGGLVMSFEGKPLQVITPNSPMGEALLGRKAGETIEIEMRESSREYKILSNS